eukprot:c3037_g1_i1.p1 GENE.c3037_g1_i1~~c3037_g1_i1.p1  ORF type:complete len:227 (+),score=34.00 c3037_g1_i1:80-682(+)
MSAATMRSTTTNLQTSLQGISSFHFLDGPLQAEGKAEGQRAWWELVKHDDNDFTYEGIEKSLELITQTYATHGPFDGVLGFSQGAGLAGLLLAMQSTSPQPWNFKFAIFVGGFRFRQRGWQALAEQAPFNVPTLHVAGEKDQVIPVAASQRFATLFVNPTQYVHGGGHVVPQRQADLEIYWDFIKSQHQLATGAPAQAKL